MQSSKILLNYLQLPATLKTFCNFKEMKGNLIIISSPSGGGKGTLIREILKTVPRIGYSVSYTTRPPRAGESERGDYFFVTPEKFTDLIGRDEFLEHAEVHGNFYGTSVKQIYDQISIGSDVILEIDVQGAESIRQKMPEAVSIFIMPPSFEILSARLEGRATETASDLALRLRNAAGEIRRYENFEYVVINDQVARAVADLQTIILAERLKRVRQTEPIQAILDSFDNSK